LRLRQQKNKHTYRSDNEEDIQAGVDVFKKEGEGVEGEMDDLDVYIQGLTDENLYGIVTISI
jgi:hypothetical protein